MISGASRIEISKLLLAPTVPSLVVILIFDTPEKSLLGLYLPILNAFVKAWALPLTVILLSSIPSPSMNSKFSVPIVTNPFVTVIVAVWISPSTSITLKSWGRAGA